MSEQPGPLSKIWFRFPCQDADLPRLALAALNVYQAQRFALSHGLAMDEVRPKGDVRQFTLLVSTPRLEEVVLGLRLEGVQLGWVQCAEQAALAIAQELGLPGKLCVPAGPAAPAEEDAP